MFHDFLSLIFPRTCLHCQQSLISQEKYLCTACKIDLPLTRDWDNPENTLFQKFAFEQKINSATSFLFFQNKGVTKKLLHHLKYRGKKELGVLLGRWFSPFLDQIQADMIVPVPLHKARFKKRTYNQSEQIGRGISEELGIELKSDLVKRTVATLTQTNRTKTERWKNVQNIYSPIKEDIAGRSVMVFDDVITTGATIGMLCERLVEADVSEIHVASLARGK